MNVYGVRENETDLKKNSESRKLFGGHNWLYPSAGKKK